MIGQLTNHQPLRNQKMHEKSLTFMNTAQYFRISPFLGLSPHFPWNLLYASICFSVIGQKMTSSIFFGICDVLSRGLRPSGIWTVPDRLLELWSWVCEFSTLEATYSRQIPSQEEIRQKLVHKPRRQSLGKEPRLDVWWACTCTTNPRDCQFFLWSFLRLSDLQRKRDFICPLFFRSQTAWITPIQHSP